MSDALPGSENRTVVVRAPTRIDFGGGWTDVPPYSSTVGGQVCNVAIDLRATVRLSTSRHDRPDHRAPASHLVGAALRHWDVRDATVELTSDFPVGAGLGGSSAAGVALAGALAAWRGESPDRASLAEHSRTVEVEECGIAGGRQDHYAAAFGGALGLRFAAGGREDLVEVRRIPLDERTRRALETRCVLAYTGEARVSAATIDAVLDAVRDGDARVTGTLGRMAEQAALMVDALEAGDVDALGLLVGEQWTQQRSLHTAITTPTIDRLLDAARRAGALGGKALGASGGGCVIAIAPADRADAVREALADGAELLEFAIDEEGVTEGVGSRRSEAPGI
ncbi:MAG TPA: hypothetical protein VGE02_14175 [Gemmatimonadales bacterium]